MGRARPCITILLFALAIGCGDQEIVKYQTERQAPPRVAVKKSRASSDQRMLAAIIRHADRTWFFKLLGQTAKVMEQTEPFENFIRSVHFTDGDKIAWTVPEGWQELPGSESRYATLKNESAELELSVTALGRESGSLLDNVNRWRGQIGLEPITEKQLPDATRELQLDGAMAVLVDITSAGTSAGDSLPPGHPPLQSSQRERPRSPLKYTVPDGWKEVPPGNPFRIASFEFVQDGKRVDTAISLLGGAAGGLLANVNRWREQVGMPPIDDAQLREDLRPIEVAGSPAHLVELVGSESATVGVILEQGSQSWFFKMTGPSDVVVGQKAAFESLVRSVRFEP